MFFFLIVPSSSFPLFPYTTLFRSVRVLRAGVRGVPAGARARLRGVRRVRVQRRPHPLMRRVLLAAALARSEEHTSELQSPCNLACRRLLGKKKLEHDTR